MGESDAHPADDPERGASEATPTNEGEIATAEGEARGRFPWGWLVLVALVIEFGIYGSKGHIDVCVGKEGVHQFDLVGQERTDENRWKFPRCESRTNLGLRSTYEDKVGDAVRVACRGATMLQHRGERHACVSAEDGWVQRIESWTCPPWHRHYWSHLFWFLAG